ncbi:MAG: sugar ABC transporter ATP-binding protein [Chloroflexaceae bacterium]|nr:sugar ABC transporter ATP-binding protein [Chloroflexaceae bacterium]
MQPLLHGEQLSKQFGTLIALRGVSLSIAPGEVVGLVGRSGAGKSVLMSLLAGHMVPNTGTLAIAGQAVRWPFSARTHGLAVIHQHPVLADQLDITSNIFLGCEIGSPARLGWMRVPNRRQMDQQALEILQQLDVSISSLREKVSNLSSEQRRACGYRACAGQSGAAGHYRRSGDTAELSLSADLAGAD